MKFTIKRAVVVGSGTMGAAIAAHLANAGIRVTLLDIVPDRLTQAETDEGLTLDSPLFRNRIVRQGFERSLKAKPANFFTAETADLVRLGNLEDDFSAISEADWVIEAVVENLEIKRQLMERIDRGRSPKTIVSTNTSGIPVSSIAAGRSPGFREHFFGTHFFNPPRYLQLLEVIPIKETALEVLRDICWFGEYRLGKGVVLAKDTPNFIANRLGFGSGAFALDYILEHGYSVEEVDAVTGPVLGRPKTATFRLIDLVGIDVWENVGRNLAPAIPYDEDAISYLNSDKANSLMHTLVQKGWLGNKTKGGFYKEVRRPEGEKEFWTLNLQTLEYEPPKKPRFDSVGRARNIEGLGDRLKAMLSAQDRGAELAQVLTFQSLSYASERIPEIADTPLPIDNSIRWGFGHEAGPFEIWDLLGVADLCTAMKEAGFTPAPWVIEMTGAGIKTFYEYEGNRKIGVYNPALGGYEPIERPDGLIILKEEVSSGKVIQRNDGASLIDMGGGVACVEFHTKMNALDADIIEMLQISLDCVEEEFEGLVIGNDSANFSAGANLFMVLLAAKNGLWDQLELMARTLQDVNMRIRYFPKPVILAPAGLTLGGGSEMSMHGSRIVAGAELYAGLVEVGVGIIPAGGGTKEIMRRMINPVMRTKNANLLPFLQRAFEQIGTAKVSTSAEEAREMAILGPADRVVMNRDLLLTEARKEVLYMAGSGFHPPLPEKIYAGGRDPLAALRVMIYMMKEGNYISDYDAHIGEKLGYVLTGGELSQPDWVSEQYILDLEREALLSLCGEQKTQERISYMLQTGKPLRN